MHLLILGLFLTIGITPEVMGLESILGPAVRNAFLGVGGSSPSLHAAPTNDDGDIQTPKQIQMNLPEDESAHQSRRQEADTSNDNSQ